MVLGRCVLHGGVVREEQVSDRANAEVVERYRSLCVINNYASTIFRGKLLKILKFLFE